MVLPFEIFRYTRGCVVFAAARFENEIIVAVTE